MEGENVKSGPRRGSVEFQLQGWIKEGFFKCKVTMRRDL